MKLLSMRAYAASRKERGLSGGSLASVQKAVASGRIHLVDGKIDPVAADDGWIRNTSGTAQERGAGGGAKPSALVVAGAESGSKDPEDYLAARARKEAAMADLAEMEAAELRGEMVRTEEVASCWGEMLVALRARFLVLPSMAAPLVAPPGKATEVQATLRKLVNEALDELSGDGIPEGAKKRARRIAEDTEAAA